MRVWGIVVLAGVLLGAAPSSPAGTPAGPPATIEQWLSTYQTAWDALNTYSATITTREYLNGKIQDRVYAIKFKKPSTVRLDIVAGDGKGGAALWTGGDRVVGHQGWLPFIHLNLDIHDKKATSMRGHTVAQASFGAALETIKSIKWKSTSVTVDGDKSVLTGIVADPAQDDGIAKEVMTLGPNGLPVELTEFEPDGSIARHEVYTDVQINVTLPDSTWKL